MGQRDAISGQRRGVRGEPLTAFLICDLGALVRGRLMATADVPDRLATGIGWLPADYAITPWGPLAGYPLHHPEFLPPDDAVGAVARGQTVLFLAAASR